MLDYKKLPQHPGVYIMKNASGEVIYVGKAKSLRNRVSQYFQNNKAHSAKVRAMVSNISDYEYVLTGSEFEAFILECNLIKKFKPHYNILLKDDKTFPYLRVTAKEQYPKMSVARKVKEDGAVYFGPFLSVKTIRDTIDLVKRLFGIATCDRVFPRDIGKERPCLNYHMKLCVAPCLPQVSAEDYRAVFDRAIAFLKGERNECVALLKKDMKQAVERLDFEFAARIRDMITEIEKLSQKQAVVLQDKRDLDCIAVVKNGTEAYVQVYFVRNGVLLNRFQSKMEDCEEDTVEDLTYAFVQQFYDENSIPDEVLVSSEGLDLLGGFLSEKKGRKVTLRCPQRGEKKKLCEMARNNVLETIRKEHEENEKTAELLKQFCLYTGVREIPERIEAIDISHTSGAETVGAVAVFINGRASRRDHRYFKVKNPDGNNDYENMCEVVVRRFERAKNHSEGFVGLPDLLLVDGGKGQVSVVRKCLEEQGFGIVPVLGVVKDDFHQTRGLATAEQVFELEKDTPFFHLLSEIQNEVHDSAVRFHHKQRSKNAVRSSLLGIEGIGETRRRALMRAFKTIQAIREATIDELLKVPSMDRSSARNVFEHFHHEE